MFNLIKKNSSEYTKFILKRATFDLNFLSFATYSFSLLSSLFTFINTWSSRLLILGLVFFHFKIQGQNASLSPALSQMSYLLPGWTIFRNLVYSLLYLQLPLALILDFLKLLNKEYQKMFNWLKKWLINFLVATFSFAFASFVIDLIFILLIIYSAATSQLPEEVFGYFFKLI